MPPVDDDDVVRLQSALKDAQTALNFSLEQVGQFSMASGSRSSGGGGSGGGDGSSSRTTYEMLTGGGGGAAASTITDGGEGQDLGAVYTPEMWDTEDVILWLGWTGTHAQHLPRTAAPQ